MFYKHFYLFVWLCIIFGIGKTSISRKGLITKPTMIFKLWPVLVVIVILSSNVFTINGINDFSIRRDLEKISYVNDLVINIFIVCANSLNSGIDFRALYDIINNTINTLKLSNKSLILITRKMNIYIVLLTVIHVILITGEIMNTSPPFIFLTRIPLCLAILHLSAHLYLVLAILKLVNLNLSAIFNNKEATMTELLTRRKIVLYVIHPDIKFINAYNQISNVDIKFLCKVYDNLCTTLQLLHNIHGVQILLSIWLMFSNAVIAVTLIACNQANPQWLVIAKGITPFAWCLIGCCIEDQLFKETEQTEIFIMKYIIDYRCDAPKRSILETFKQLVVTNRLQFNACNLFELNFSMIMGTIVNVITYSIILVQLFLSK